MIIILFLKRILDGYPDWDPEAVYYAIGAEVLIIDTPIAALVCRFVVLHL